MDPAATVDVAAARQIPVSHRQSRTADTEQMNTCAKNDSPNPFNEPLNSGLCWFFLCKIYTTQASCLGFSFHYIRYFFFKFKYLPPTLSSKPVQLLVNAGI